MEDVLMFRGIVLVLGVVVAGFVGFLWGRDRGEELGRELGRDVGYEEGWNAAWEERTDVYETALDRCVGAEVRHAE